MMPHNAPYASSFFHKGEYTGESANVSRVLDSFTSRNGYDKRLRPGYKGENIVTVFYTGKEERVGTYLHWATASIQYNAAMTPVALLW